MDPDANLIDWTAVQFGGVIMAPDVYYALHTYLARLGAAEYAAFRATRPGKRARYSPSDYHRQLVTLLGQNDEQGFKALKAEQGYASALGH